MDSERDEEELVSECASVQAGERGGKGRPFIHSFILPPSNQTINPSIRQGTYAPYILSEGPRNKGVADERKGDVKGGIRAV